MPDLYIIADNSLGRAYRAGLAAEVSNSSVFENTLFYPQTAINSVTYQGRRVAYPFYFETAALLYNADYLQSFADKAGKSLEETVPSTIQDIIDFAGNYDAPEGVTSVFSWDVGDIFYNYYFIGESSDLGGECGDDRDKIDIYNADTISALQVFQQLNQYFSLDTDENSYSDILDDFAQGKSVFTVATTDALKTLSEKISSSAGGDETESAASDSRMQQARFRITEQYRSRTSRIHSERAASLSQTALSSTAILKSRRERRILPRSSMRTRARISLTGQVTCSAGTESPTVILTQTVLSRHTRVRNVSQKSAEPEISGYCWRIPWKMSGTERTRTNP